MFIADSVGPGIGAVKHANGIDTWVTTLRYRTNFLQTFRINSCGVFGPYTDTVPGFHYKVDTNALSYNYVDFFFMNLLFSPRGNFVVFTGRDTAAADLNYYYYIMPFDDRTGHFRNDSLKRFQIWGNLIRTRELFSFSGAFLYGESFPDSATSSDFYCYDYAQEKITPIHPFLDIYMLDYGMQGDMLIYNISKTADVCLVNRIKQIDSPYPVPQVENPIPGVTLPFGGKSGGIVSRNNYVMSFYDPEYRRPSPYASFRPEVAVAPAYCAESPVVLSGSTQVGVDSLVWELGGARNYRQKDTDTLSLQLSPGTYTLRVKSYKYCLEEEVRDTFRVEDRPFFTLSQDTLYSCEGKVVALPAPDTSNGAWAWVEAGDTVHQGRPGNWYRAEASNSCGISSDSAFIREVNIETPNLITPNGDGRNDCFEPLNAPEVNSLGTDAFRIYSQWGGLIYEDNRCRWCPGNVPPGLYFFELTTAQRCTSKGWVEVVK